MIRFTSQKKKNRSPKNKNPVHTWLPRSPTARFYGGDPPDPGEADHLAGEDSAGASHRKAQVFGPGFFLGNMWDRA